MAGPGSAGVPQGAGARPWLRPAGCVAAEAQGGREGPHADAQARGEDRAAGRSRWRGPGSRGSVKGTICEIDESQ